MLTRSKLKEMAKDAASSDLERSGKILKKFPSKRSRKQRDWIEPMQGRVNATLKSDQAKMTRIMEGEHQNKREHTNKEKASLPLLNPSVSEKGKQKWSEPKQEKVNTSVKSDQEHTKKEKASPPLLNPSVSEKGKQVKKVAQSNQKWSEPKQEKVNTTVKSAQVEPPAMELMQINDPIDVEPLAVEPKQEDSLADTCQAIRSQMDKARSDLLEIDPGRKSALYHAIGSVEHARLVMARWRFELQKMLDEKTLKGPKESDAAGNG